MTHDTSYGSTLNLWERSDETHRLIEGRWSSLTIPQIGRWLVTQKIDGINGRVILDWKYDEELDQWSPRVEIAGRTDAANLPKLLLPEAFGVELASELTHRAFNALKCIQHGGESDAELTAALLATPTKMVLYGEFHGPGTQKGGKYTDKKSFRVFDVATYRGIAEHGHWGHPYWRSWEDVETAANILGVYTVPVISYSAPLPEIVEMVKSGVVSRLNSSPTGEPFFAEGVVARTDPYLFDWRGKRVMFKLKGRDLV